MHKVCKSNCLINQNLNLKSFLNLRFFPRWKEAEQIQASEMNYSLDDHQWKQDWINTVSLAGTAGTSLEQTHVFALAHILRRPIIVYAVKYVKSRKGETIDYARFEGRYATYFKENVVSLFFNEHWSTTAIKRPLPEVIMPFTDKLRSKV